MLIEVRQPVREISIWKNKLLRRRMHGRLCRPAYRNERCGPFFDVWQMRITRLINYNIISIQKRKKKKREAENVEEGKSVRVEENIFDYAYHWEKQSWNSLVYFVAYRIDFLGIAHA